MYTVPIIAPDLRHEETIIQAVHALDILKKTIHSVFEKIDARIEGNKIRVKELRFRIFRAEERTKCLFGVTRALQIYAPAHFPATNVLLDLPSTFNMTKDNGEQLSNQSIAQQQQQQQQPYILYEVSRVECEHEPKDMQNKLVFFHVRTTTATEPDAKIISDMGGIISDYIAASRARINGNSLGRAPDNLRSTAALLRFNSDELAYSTIAEESAQSKETWKRAKIYKNQRLSGALQRKEQQQYLEPAPHSLANRYQTRATPSGELRYTPHMHEAPSIDLPLDLPTLKGVAIDIHFMGSTDMHSKITPSSAAIPPANESTTKIENEQKLEIAESLPTTQITALMTTTTTTTEMPTSSASIQETGPPPPPPPPLPVSLAAHPPPPVVPTASSAGSDTRSALMDAIRKAGGARGLRSAAAAPVVDVVDTNKQHDENKNKISIKRNATVSGGSGGDLMADLHNKLLMRRKGIAGNNSGMSINSNNSNISLVENRHVKRREMTVGNSVIERLSALIPPPPSKTKIEQEEKRKHLHLQHSDDDDDDDDNTNNEDDEDWD